jgi:hypothetical protein
MEAARDFVTNPAAHLHTNGSAGDFAAIFTQDSLCDTSKIAGGSHNLRKDLNNFA